MTKKNLKKKGIGDLSFLLVVYKHGWLLWDKDVGIHRQIENEYIRKINQITCATQKCWWENLFSWLATWLFPGSQTWEFLSQTFNHQLLMNLLLHLQIKKRRKISTSAEGSKSTWPVYGKCKMKTWRKKQFTERLHNLTNFSS